MRNNDIDPKVLYSLLKKYYDGGPHFEDPSLGGIENAQSGLGMFGNQLQVANPFGQSNNQLQQGNQNFGTPQDTRPLIYDWNNNPDGHDPYMNQIMGQDKLSRKEEQYRKDNRLTSTTPNLQSSSEFFASENSANKSLFNNQDAADASSNRGTIYDSEQGDNSNSVGANTAGYQWNDDKSAWEKYVQKGSAQEATAEEDKQNQWGNLLRSGLASPGGMGLEGTLYQLGRGIGADPGTKGKGALIGAAGLSSAFKAGRNVLSGVGSQKVNDETRRFYEQQLNRVNYTPDAQSQDNNYTGGYGFAEGGEKKGDPQKPTKISKYDRINSGINRTRFDLINAGIDPITGETVPLRDEGTVLGDLQRTYSNYKTNTHPNASIDDRDERFAEWEAGQKAILNLGAFGSGRTNHMEGGEQQQQDTGLQIGEYVEFEHGGKKVAGKIKKIENGKIYV